MTSYDAEISITCLYCGVPLHINLAKYPKTETEIMRLSGDESPKTVMVYLLPDVLETEPVEKS